MSIKGYWQLPVKAKKRWKEGVWIIDHGSCEPWSHQPFAPDCRWCLVDVDAIKV